jgi:hypothetical protein
MKQLMWYLLCKLIGHNMYKKDEGYNPVHRREKCARCSYETKSYPIQTIGSFTIRSDR